MEHAFLQTWLLYAGDRDKNRVSFLLWKQHIAQACEELFLIRGPLGPGSLT